MKDDNILLRKVPDRLTNLLKGIGIIVVSAVISFVVWIAIMFIGFAEMFKGQNIPQLLGWYLASYF